MRRRIVIILGIFFSISAFFLTNSRYSFADQNSLIYPRAVFGTFVSVRPHKGRHAGRLFAALAEGLPLHIQYPISPRNDEPDGYQEKRIPIPPRWIAEYERYR